MLRTIRLHGRLAKEFGPSFEFAVASPAEAIQALIHLVPGFRAALERGAYRVIRGRRRSGRDTSAAELHLRMAEAEQQIHIVPAARGANRGRSIGKIVLGVVLIATVTYFTAGVGTAAAAGAAGGATAGGAGAGGSVLATMATQSALSLGIGLALSGVSGLLSPTSSNASTESGDDQSNSFAGLINNARAGAAVPVVFGEVEVGSVVVSAAIHAETRGNDNGA